MNNWLKIGLPIVMAILLVISAVAVTLAVTSGNPSKQVVSASYTTQSTSETQVARSANCANCPQVSSCNGDGTGCTTAGTQGGCCATGDTGVYVPKTNSGGGCCRGR